MKRHRERNLKCTTEEATMERLHTVWFQVNDIWGKGKTVETAKQSVIERIS